MSPRKRNGCLIWSGSIFTAALISILMGVAIVMGFVLIASLRVVWKEEKIQAELEKSLKSISPLTNATLLSYETHITKDVACLFTGPVVLVDAKYTADVLPLVVYNYYDQQLKEQGWEFGDTRGTDWSDDQTKMPYLDASYSKEGGYKALLQYAREYSDAPWTYRLLVEWQGGRYPCSSNK